MVNGGWLDTVLGSWLEVVLRSWVEMVDLGDREPGLYSGVNSGS